MAAVSIQLMPRSTAWRIAAIDCLSSWLPQPTAQSPPPMAQAPRPDGRDVHVGASEPPLRQRRLADLLLPFA